MKSIKTIYVLSVLVIIISATCCIIPFLTNNELANKTMVSSFGDTVTLYGKGIYARNSVSGALQAIAQDLVTLVLVIPGMLTSLLLTKKKSLTGKFLLTGMFGYMLYTYMSYAFLMFYNDLFLLYVANMTLSFYGFVLCILMLTKEPTVERIKQGMPVKGLRIFLIISGVLILLMWLGRIIPTIGKNTAPVGLDNCTTAVIQAMDLGIIVPACFVIAHLLKIRHKLGFILGPVIVVKAVTLVTAVIAMAVFMHTSGESDETMSFIVFGVICVLAFYYFFRVMRQLRKA